MTRSSPYVRSETAKVFVGQFKQPTLAKAIEAAARAVRSQLDLSMADSTQLPVDVLELARRLGLRFADEFSENSRFEGTYSAFGDASTIRLSRSSTKARRRMTIAHEIGHALFRRALDRKIPVTSRLEQEAEEYICRQFSAALLMPLDQIRFVVKSLPSDDASAIVLALESAARKFDVSLPALVHRLRQVSESVGPSLVLLCLSRFANTYKKNNPQLRVFVHVELGRLRALHTWFNRSAAGLRLQNAEELFKQWMESLTNNEAPIGGRFQLSDSGKLIRATADSIAWSREEIEFSVNENGRWKTACLPSLTASCLYVKRGWSLDEPYILTIARKTRQGSMIE